MAHQTPFCASYVNFNTKLLRAANPKAFRDFYYNVNLRNLRNLGPAQRHIGLLIRFAESASTLIYSLPENGTGAVHDLGAIVANWNLAVDTLETAISRTNNQNPTRQDYITAAIQSIDNNAHKPNPEIDVVGYWGLVASLCEDAVDVSSVLNYRGFPIANDYDAVKKLNTLTLTRSVGAAVPDKIQHKDEIHLYKAKKNAVFALVVYPSQVEMAGHRLSRLAFVWSHTSRAVEQWLEHKFPPRNYRSGIQKLCYYNGGTFLMDSEWQYVHHKTWVPPDVGHIQALEELDARYEEHVAVTSFNVRKTIPYRTNRFRPY